MSDYEDGPIACWHRNKIGIIIGVFIWTAIVIAILYGIMDCKTPEQKKQEIKAAGDLQEYQASKDLEAPAHAEKAARQNIRRVR